MDEIKNINKKSIPSRILITRNIFLKALSLLYLISFSHIYGQIQGLWGDDGLLPAKTFIERILIVQAKKLENKEANLLLKNHPLLIMFSNFPTPLIFLSKFSNLPSFSSFGFNSLIETMLHILCLIGAFLSLLILVNKKLFLSQLSFGILWYIYLNFVLIGQNFFKAEWDYLLLETGFYAILFSPSNYSKINIITPINNISLYLLRFLLFKVLFSIGNNLMFSDDPFWMSFNGLNFFFQTQLSLNKLSIFGHFMNESFKRILSAIYYSILLYLPYGLFLVWRRFNIFCGQMIFLFHLGLMLFGNWDIYPILNMIINIVNFDDYFWRAVLSEKILKYLGVDEISEIINKYFNELEIKNEKEQEQEEEDNRQKQGLESKIKNEKDETEKKKLKEELEKLTNKWRANLMRFEDEEEQLGKIEETMDSESSFLREVFIFCNFFCCYLLVICFLVFKLKNLLTGKLLLKAPELKDVKFMNDIYMFYIFIYFTAVILNMIVLKVKSFVFKMFEITDIDLKEAKEAKEEKAKKSLMSKIISKILSFLKYTYYLVKTFFYLTIFILVFFGNIQKFYTGMGITLINEEDSKSTANIISSTSSSLAALSEVLFNRFHLFGSYGQLQREINGVTGREELEIIYNLENTNIWKEIKFHHKLGLTTKPKFLPLFSRLDLLMTQSSSAINLDDSPWISILLGRIFERNPIVLDLLNLPVLKQQVINHYSFVEKIKTLFLGYENKENEDILTNQVKKIKVDLFLYSFTKKKGEKLIRRKRYKEFLGNIEKYALNPIFKIFGLNEIDENREFKTNIFQLIPIWDLVIITALLGKILKNN